MVAAVLELEVYFCERAKEEAKRAYDLDKRRVQNLSGLGMSSLFILLPMKTENAGRATHNLKTLNGNYHEAPGSSVKTITDTKIPVRLPIEHQRSFGLPRPCKDADKQTGGKVKAEGKLQEGSLLRSGYASSLLKRYDVS